MTCRRRRGAAWETAIRVTPLVDDGVTAKFSSVRQKLHVALALGIHWALTFTPPLMLHVVGVLSQAGHVGVEAHVEGDVVLARLEEQRIALGAELVGLHLREDAGGGALDVGGRHARVEDVDVRAEDGGVRRGDRAGRGDARDGRHRPAAAARAKTADMIFSIIARGNLVLGILCPTYCLAGPKGA